jgi:hypothetical protein
MIRSCAGRAEFDIRRIYRLDRKEQPTNEVRSFSAVAVRMFPSRSAGNCRLELSGGLKSPYFKGINGGRTRDRTLDLSRVKGTLSR